MNYFIHHFDSYREVMGLWNALASKEAYDNIAVTAFGNDEGFCYLGNGDFAQFNYVMNSDLPIYQLDTETGSQPIALDIGTAIFVGKIKLDISMPQDPRRVSIMLARQIETILSKYTNVSREGIFLFNENGEQICTNIVERIDNTLQYIIGLYLQKPEIEIETGLCYQSNLGGLNLSPDKEQKVVQEISLFVPLAGANEELDRETRERLVDDVYTFSTAYIPLNKEDYL